MDARSSRMIHRGGLAGIIAGTLSILIFVVYALTRMGAAGDRRFGSLDPVLFVVPLLLVATLLALRARYRPEVGSWGRRALDLAVVAGAAIALGFFGASWIGFARSGNYLIFPAGVLLILGLGVFALSGFHAAIRPRRVSHVSLLLALASPGAIVISQIVAFLGGGRLLYIDDWYFRAAYAVSGLLWILLGASLRAEGPRMSGLEVREPA